MGITAVSSFGIFFWYFCMVSFYDIILQKHLYVTKCQASAILMARSNYMLSFELFVINLLLQIVLWLPFMKLFHVHW